MNIESHQPEYLGLKQDMEAAFAHDREYVLTSLEVETVYLCLCRLQALEETASKGDWEGLKAYLPHPESEGHA